MKTISRTKVKSLKNEFEFKILDYVYVNLQVGELINTLNKHPTMTKGISDEGFRWYKVVDKTKKETIQDLEHCKALDETEIKELNNDIEELREVVRLQQISLDKKQSLLESDLIVIDALGQNVETAIKIIEHTNEPDNDLASVALGIVKQNYELHKRLFKIKRKS